LKALVLVFFSIITTVHAGDSRADENVLNQLNDEQLLQLRKKAIARVDIIDTYEAAKYGVGPETDLEVINRSYVAFVDSSQRWLDLGQYQKKNSAQCARFMTNTKSIIAELTSRYQTAQQQVDDSIESLALRTRVESLGILLLNDLQLAESGSEGGQSPLLRVGADCQLVDRPSWILAGHQLETSLKTLNEKLWGKRGVIKAYVVSDPFVRLLNNEEKNNGTWSIVKYSTETMVAFAAVSFGTRRVMPLVDAIAGARVSTYLKAATLLTLASYGAVKGYSFAKKLNRDEGYGDPWTQIQNSTNDLLDLDLKDSHAYYLLSRELERNILRYNQTLIESLGPDIQQAEDRFGTLDRAKKIAQSKVTEIDSEIMTRKKENK
jgi:hypothetical protein